jgi:hypothetical protein
MLLFYLAISNILYMFANNKFEMKDMSKISVKHFLNKNITVSTRNGNFQKYPVYIKVTFQRKSTEIKSIIFNSFMNDYEFKTTPKESFKKEAAMIEFFVKKGYSEQGDDFTLKGISDTCKEYKKILIRDIYKLYVLNDFDKYLEQITDPFSLVVKLRHEYVPTTLYFMSAIKLLSDKNGVLQFEHQFNIVKLIDFIKIPNYSHLSIIDIFNWQYGDVKRAFIKEAKSVYKLNENEISEIISVIDTGIEQLIN